MRRSKRIKTKRSQNDKSIVPGPRSNILPSQSKRTERLVARYSGSSFSLGTSSGYSFFTIDSSQLSNASPWTALSGLYMFVRPILAKVTITGARSTASSDNPVVGFASTPDGAAVGTTAMNISTFEAPNTVSKTLPPGGEVSFTFKPYIAIAAYNTPTNGYVPMQCPRVSLNSLPRIYFGDILLLTPGVVITSTANYIQLKVEYVMEFDTIDNSNIN